MGVPQFSFQASYCLAECRLGSGWLRMQAHRWAQVRDGKDEVKDAGSDIHDSLLGGKLDRPLDLMTASVVSVYSLTATYVRHLG